MGALSPLCLSASSILFARRRPLCALAVLRAYPHPLRVGRNPDADADGGYDTTTKKTSRTHQTGDAPSSSHSKRAMRLPLSLFSFQWARVDCADITGGEGRGRAPKKASKKKAPSKPRDSGSDNGALSKKKKKRTRSSNDEIHVSSRGVQIPNYVDDFEEVEKNAETIDYAEAAAPLKEEDEMKNVLGHCRLGGHEDDP
ncbi:hypothetical protein OH77DRAFT_1432193 [Trametes cingulata]|nr:hypothetical protein OH77DRAFT_1432193 [Trametes cingulata]